MGYEDETSPLVPKSHRRPQGRMNTRVPREIDPERISSRKFSPQPHLLELPQTQQPQILPRRAHTQPPRVPHRRRNAPGVLSPQPPPGLSPPQNPGGPPPSSFERAEGILGDATNATLDEIRALSVLIEKSHAQLESVVNTARRTLENANAELARASMSATRKEGARRKDLAAIRRELAAAQRERKALSDELEELKVRRPLTGNAKHDEAVAKEDMEAARAALSKAESEAKEAAAMLKAVRDKRRDAEKAAISAAEESAIAEAEKEAEIADTLASGVGMTELLHRLKAQLAAAQEEHWRLDKTQKNAKIAWRAVVASESRIKEYLELYGKCVAHIGDPTTATSAEGFARSFLVGEED